MAITKNCKFKTRARYWTIAAAKEFCMKILAYILIPFIFIFSDETSADVYRYISKDGVECYTDAPVNRKSVLIIREPRRKDKKTYRKKSVETNKRIPDNQQKKLASKSRSLALPVDGIISSKVGLRNDPFDGLVRNHKGVDIAIAEGTPVKPVAPGIITYSGTRGGYGNIVIVEHEGGMTTLYAHNNTNLVATGDHIDKQTTIALTGSTGRSTGPHLHFEAWSEGQNITAQFLDNPSSIQKYSTRKTVTRKNSATRKIVMADGTILLTNVPLIHP
jgi:murein DD-endopeptidase MepM/ murein hydrolase activator NlpD